MCSHSPLLAAQTWVFRIFIHQYFLIFIFRDLSCIWQVIANKTHVEAMDRHFSACSAWRDGCAHWTVSIVSYFRNIHYSLSIPICYCFVCLTFHAAIVLNHFRGESSVLCRNMVVARLFFIWRVMKYVCDLSRQVECFTVLGSIIKMRWG